MSEEKRSSIGELLSMLGKLIAVVMVVRYGALIVEHYYHFLPTTGLIADAMIYVGLYAPMALMIVVALDAVWDKYGIAKLVVLVLCAAIVIVTFFPGVRATIENYIGVSGMIGL